MSHTLKFISVSFFAAIFIFVPFLIAIADDDSGDHKRKRERKRDGSHSGSSIKIVRNTFYQETCGECHFAYQPDLMPAAAWTALMNNLDDHFGEAIELDDDSIKTISEYLNANAAEKSRSKRGRKIVESLRNKIPARITEIPYILHEHHEISPDVFNRKSIGSFANCGACHTKAEDGIYDDDYVKIPQ